MALPAQRLRPPTPERYADAVHRYARAVLGDERAADEVVAATLADARRLSRRRELIDLAHALCRELVEAELGPEELAAEERADAAPPAPGPCAAAELALSLDLDGRLRGGGRAELRAHLAACPPCARLAVVLAAQRIAVRIALGDTARSPAGRRLLS